MTDHNNDIGTSQIDDDANFVQPYEIRFMYVQHPEAGEVLCLGTTDAQLGQVIFTLTPEGAARVATTLAGMIRRLPELRSEWVATSGGRA